MRSQIKQTQQRRAVGNEPAALPLRPTSHWRRAGLITGVLVFVLGALHLYSMNRIAVQGYAIRSAEKRLAELQQESRQLRIQEAELRSLDRIEEATGRLGMQESKEVSYIEENNSLALR